MWLTPKYTIVISVFSPNAGKHGPEKTPYLDIFSKDSTESFADASPNLTYGPNGYDH